MRLHNVLLKCFAGLMVATLAVFPALAQTELPSDLQQKIDKIASEVLEKTGTPAASIAVVKDGQIVYIKAYGDACLDPRTSAKPEMRFSTGSVSKPFTAAAILLLQEQGKLSIDDKVSRFIPDLTRANEVTIRQLLSMTSGYQEFWPVDYVLPMMQKPVTPRKIVDQWAHKPLNFDPGTKWAISDTNYVIAGLIVEKASGMPLHRFVKEKIFGPLGMTNVAAVDDDELSSSDPVGYMSYGIGPLRPAPREAKGWLFGGEDWAMTARDLAKWNISIIDQKLLKPSSYHNLESDVLLKSGLGTRNALGIAVTWQLGRRALYNLGDVSGFSAANTIFPDDRVAVAVLANRDAGAPGEIARRISPLLMTKADPSAPQQLQVARKVFEGLQHGTLDRSLLTEDANSYFNEVALQDFAASLGPLGTPQEFVETNRIESNGMVSRTYRIKFTQKALAVNTTELPSGKLEQYSVEND